jgi:hypothetical protein
MDKVQKPNNPEYKLSSKPFSIYKNILSLQKIEEWYLGWVNIRHATYTNTDTSTWVIVGAELKLMDVCEITVKKWDNVRNRDNGYLLS